MGIPRPPAGSGPQGRQLWRSVLTRFELNAAELAVLRRACRAADRCEALEAVLAETGLTTRTAAGAVKVNPVVSELRASEIAFARLLVCLRIPDGSAEVGEVAGQRRGLRGVYGLGDAS
jgi:hypothetical protein